MNECIIEYGSILSGGQMYFCELKLSENTVRPQPQIQQYIIIERLKSKVL